MDSSAYYSAGCEDHIGSVVMALPNISKHSIDDHHVSKLHQLEMAYQESLRSIESVVKDENNRRLRLQILTLGDDNDDLCEHVTRVEDRYDALEQDYGEMQNQLAQSREDSARYENELRVHMRELSILKVIHPKIDMSCD